MCGQWEATSVNVLSNLVRCSLNSHACLSSFFVQYPDGESDSPFVLLTDNPSHLTVKLQVSGKHKIC